jgi:RimJ/RimL family protein N-acetyltransferase
VSALSDGVVALRPWRMADAEALAKAWTDPDIVRWTAVPDDRSVEAAGRWIAGWDVRRRRGVALDLVVTPAADDTSVLGEVGASFLTTPPALGWWVQAEARGRGVATRAVRLFVNVVLAAGRVTEVVADVDAANPASLAVARNAGFRATATPGRFAIVL